MWQARSGRAGGRRSADAADGTHNDRRNRRMSTQTQSSKSSTRGWTGQITQLAAIVGLVLVAKGAFAEPFYVPSASMEPTLLIGDALLASKFPYGYSSASLPIHISFPETGRVF